MNSSATCASSSPLSSWMKWPALRMVVCGCPAAPGTCRCMNASAPRVIGSRLPKAVRKGFSHLHSRSQAARLAGTAGSFSWIGTRRGKARAAALYFAAGKGAS